jgi:MFS family permease
MYLITYLDRVNISTAAPVISEEFGFNKVTMGFIFSAFVWAYAIFQVPGGWLSDRFGPRTVLTAIVSYWSIMTAATAAASGAISFVIVRFLFGIGEAARFQARLARCSSGIQGRSAALSRGSHTVRVGSGQRLHRRSWC